MDNQQIDGEEMVLLEEQKKSRNTWLIWGALFLLVGGYLLFRTYQKYQELTSWQTQVTQATIQNTDNIKAIVDFINKQIAANLAAQQAASTKK